jgi:hypothetical protein
MIGALSATPDWTERGPVTNFLLPRLVRVWAIPTATSPQDEWTECIGLTELNALWGWTSIAFAPVTTRYLLLGFGDLPVFTGPDGIARSVLYAPRLAVHAAADYAEHTKAIEYTPVSSYASKFDIAPLFWTARGVPAPEPLLHQSIHRDMSDEAVYATGKGKYERGMDEVPSALVGMPIEYPDLDTSTYKSIPYFSTSTTSGGTRYALTLKLNEGPSCLLQGIEFQEPWPRRADNLGMPIRIGTLDVLATDDERAAYSSNFLHEGWRVVSRNQRLDALVFSPALALYPATRVLFPHLLRAQFLRLIFSFEPQYADVRRLELAGLSLLRDRHLSLVPLASHDLVTSEIGLRLYGRELADDYRLQAGEGMDLRLELSEGGRAFQPLLQFRSLLDLVDRTKARVLSNVRRPTNSLFEETSDTQSRDLLSSRFSSRTKVYQHGITTPDGEISKTVSRQRLTYEDSVVDVSRSFPTLGSRPFTETLGVSGGILFFEGSTNISTQINGGRTVSTTDGHQETTESRTFSKSVQAQSTRINTWYDPGTSFAVNEISSGATRKVTRSETENPSLDFLRGNEIRYDGSPLDILMTTIPLRVRLRCDYDGQGHPDVLRLAVGHLPTALRIHCSFRGLAVVPETRDAG